MFMTSSSRISPNSSLVTQTYALVAETLLPTPMVKLRVTVSCCQFVMELVAEDISLLVHHLQLS
jgi:hypothetical protein